MSRIIAIGLAAGLLSGMFGVGGGVLMVPALVLLLHSEQRRAHGTSLAAIVPISVAGVIGYAVHELVELRAAGLMALGAVAGAWLGSRLLAVVPQKALRYAFAGLMFITAVRLFLELPDTSSSLELTWAKCLALAATGVVVGVLSGLLGVGGGIFLVPVMVLFFGMDDDLAKGTSLLVVIPTGLVATYGNLKRGNADLRTAAILGTAGMASAFLGAQLAVIMSSRLSLGLFALLLIVTAVRLGLKRETPKTAVVGDAPAGGSTGTDAAAAVADVDPSHVDSAPSGSARADADAELTARHASPQPQPQGASTMREGRT